MENRRIKINRAPVLTLWAVVVAERLGYNRAEALTLAKAVTGLNAQSKGQRLGIYEPKKPSEKDKPAEKKKKQGETFAVEIMGRAVPAVKTDDGIRATVKGRAIAPNTVEHYLSLKFGDALPDAERAMQKLARSKSPKQLASVAYSLYEEFRPKIPEGVKGWGAKGELDLGQIDSLAR